MRVCHFNRCIASSIYLGLSRYERGLLLGLRPAPMGYRLYCFAVRIPFFEGVGGMVSVSTCGFHGFLWGDVGWLCDNLEVHSRQNMLECTRTWPEVAPFPLVSIVIARHD